MRFILDLRSRGILAFFKIKLIEKEISKSALMDVIEYELDWREHVHKMEIEEKNKEIRAKDKEITAKDKKISEKDEVISEKDKENAKLKAILMENGIDF